MDESLCKTDASSSGRSAKIPAPGAGEWALLLPYIGGAKQSGSAGALRRKVRSPQNPAALGVKIEGGEGEKESREKIFLPLMQRAAAQNNKAVSINNVPVSVSS